jgi:hypothetical protein
LSSDESGFPRVARAWSSGVGAGASPTPGRNENVADRTSSGLSSVPSGYASSSFEIPSAGALESNTSTPLTPRTTISRHPVRPL